MVTGDCFFPIWIFQDSRAFNPKSPSYHMVDRAISNIGAIRNLKCRMDTKDHIKPARHVSQACRAGHDSNITTSGLYLKYFEIMPPYKRM